METVELTCGACGEINKRAPKPEPENTKECKQIYFICSKCKVKNLRDGTFSGQNLEEEPEELEEELEEDEKEKKVIIRDKKIEKEATKQTKKTNHQVPKKNIWRKIWEYGQ